MEVFRDAIEGSWVGIRAPGGQPISRPSSIAVFAVRGRWHEFTASDLESGRSVAAALGIELALTYAYQRGTLYLGTKSFPDPTVQGAYQHADLLHFGVWEGERFSVHTHIYNGSPHDLIPVFDEFTIVEAPHGLRLLPKDPKRVTLAREPSFLQEFSNLGLLQVRPLTRSLARNLPRWSGTPTPGGELFVGRLAERTHFVLVGGQSVTEIMPDTTDCHSDVPNMADLQVTWRPGELVAAGLS
jgi:hypothetical protein